MAKPRQNDDAEEKDGYYGRREKRQAKERDEARRLNDGFDLLSESDDEIEED